MLVNGVHYRTVWLEGPTVRMIDQTLLPFRFAVHDAPDHAETARCIRDMVVRGAGAIGAAGGYGMAQAALEAPAEGFDAYVESAARTLAATRPTARNLFYAVDRVLAAVRAARKRRRLGRRGAAGGRGRGRGGGPAGHRGLHRHRRAGRGADPRRHADPHALQRGLARLLRLGDGARAPLPGPA